MNNNWYSILKGLNIDEKYYDKIKSYIDNHILIESNMYTSNGVIEPSTIHLSLYVIKKLCENNLLDNVVFVKSPNSDGIIIGTGSLTVNFDLQDLLMRSDKETYISLSYVNSVFELLKNKIEQQDKLYIYQLFNKIIKNNNESIIYNRYL